MHFGVRYAILTSRVEIPRDKFTSGPNTILKTINAFKMPLRIPKCRKNELFAFKTFKIQKTVQLNAIRASLNFITKNLYNKCLEDTYIVTIVCDAGP